jgi:hypothetical protein
VIVMPQTRPPDSAGATRSAEEKFLDLLLADGDHPSRGRRDNAQRRQTTQGETEQEEGR